MMSSTLNRWIVILLLAVPFCLSAEEAVESIGVIIPIHGDISPSLTVFVRRSIVEASSLDPEVIVFDINTFGGRVDSALKIATLIGNTDGAKTIAFISAGSESIGVSWSAGAIISMACDEIYMEEGTSIGAAAPVFLGQDGGTNSASEKEVSAVRAQMAALAEKNGYPVGVALAMVDEDEELLEVLLDGESRLVVRRELPDLERAARESGESLVEGKILSPAGKLLTLTAGEMARYGISSGVVDGSEELFQLLNLTMEDATEILPSSADGVIAFLTSTAVVGVLMTVGFIGAYMEISNPGFGVPGVVAIVAFATVFLGGALLGTASSLEIILFLLGLVLLVVEVFLIPGFGIAGISGILLVLAGLILSRQSFTLPELEWEWLEFQTNILSVLGSFALAVLAMVFLGAFFLKVPLFMKLTLQTTLSRSAPGEGELKSSEVSAVSPGDRGVSVTLLRPVGKVEIGGRVLIAQTRGELLERSTPIEVVEVSKGRIVVEGV